MPEIPEVQILDGDDWVCVYVGGELAHTGHSLPAEELYHLFTRKWPEKLYTTYSEDANDLLNDPPQTWEEVLTIHDQQPELFENA